MYTQSNIHVQIYLYVCFKNGVQMMVSKFTNYNSMYQNGLLRFHWVHN